MKKGIQNLILFCFLGFLFLPTVASAVVPGVTPNPIIPGVWMPFGGRVIKIFPCIAANSAPSIAFKLMPAVSPDFVGPSQPITLIFPLTFLPYLWGPPLRVGQQVMGVAGKPTECTTFSLDDIAGNLVIPMLGRQLMGSTNPFTSI